MEREAYEIAELNVHVFEAEDAIATSGIFNPDPHEGNPVGG